jgi:hypothetical protein
LTELEVEKRNREIEFKRRISDIETSAQRVEAKIQAEVIEAENVDKDLRYVYDKRLQDLFSSLTNDIQSIFDRFDAEGIPRLTNKVDSLDADINDFFGVKVPANNSSQSGRMERDLRQTRDVYEIDKQKSSKKQSLLVVTACDHIQSTEQRFHDERARLNSSMCLLEEDIVQDDRRSGMRALPRHQRAVQSVNELRAQIQSEADIRGEEDRALVDTITETSELLERMVCNSITCNQIKGFLHFSHVGIGALWCC